MLIGRYESRYGRLAADDTDKRGSVERRVELAIEMKLPVSESARELAIGERRSPAFITFLDLFTTWRNRHSVIHAQSSTVKSLSGDEPTTITRQSMEAESRARAVAYI